MPPKKGSSKEKATKAAKAGTKQIEEKHDASSDAPKVGNAADATSAKDEADVTAKRAVMPPSKKRKHAADTNGQQKAARRSGRGGAKSQPSPQQLLNFMLSTDAEALCRPEDESEAIKERGGIRTYSSSVLNPYEELMSAIILSRPISHRLGLRTIRTVLNDPYNFNSAKTTQAAGSEKQHQAVWDARTQHKDKTAKQIGQLADVVLDKFTDGKDADGIELNRVREECNHDADEIPEKLKGGINGLGKTGLDIFQRRVQWLWAEEFYSFIDDRTRDALRKLGLPQYAGDLEDLIAKHWSQLETLHLAGDDDETKKRRAFVVILERATGADLENKQDALMQAAASA